jgi:hypothetical protein
MSAGQRRPGVRSAGTARRSCAQSPCALRRRSKASQAPVRLGRLGHRVEQARRGGRADARNQLRTRKPAMRPRGFWAKRSTASTSLMCEASRNLRPPNFTKGCCARQFQLQRGAVAGGAEQHRLRLQLAARLALLAAPVADPARLLGLVRHQHQLRLALARGLVGPQRLGMALARRAITAFEASRMGWVER